MRILPIHMVAQDQDLNDIRIYWFAENLSSVERVKDSRDRLTSPRHLRWVPKIYQRSTIRQVSPRTLLVYLENH